MLKSFGKQFSRGWLYESIILIVLTVIFTVSTAMLTDNIYRKVFAEQIILAEQKAQPKPKLILKPESKTTSKKIVSNTAKKKKVTTSNSNTPNTNTSTDGNNTSVTPPTTALPPSSPPPEPSGCFVIVSGYKYNLQPIVGVRVNDPSGKSKTHSNGNFNCGTYSNPTNMTSTYISKHSGLGCWQRIAPYIVTPPAPTDPTC